ncbi:iron ABC transporter permease [Pseudomonas sp. ABC1]|uniref:FecCD family ABC transporter permease n=1 Tax=Pseudomonas sp. ABC1 TaxID=2748080 RepID=UPI0015C306F8|nr:iron ABC transporter permease [Pseudomonas sp. ABC1]QLF92146.1 iron ABC transporter permease [Pseudomonas sp. ABC1]
MTRTARYRLICLLPLPAVLLGLWLGADLLAPHDLAELFDTRTANSPFGQLLVHWRLPRVLAAFCVGACLGLAGVIFQGVFRNPLAEPYLLGSAPGAAVGAAIALLVPLPLAVALSLPLLAFLGAWGATLLVLAITRLTRITDTSGLLLAGIAVAALLGALRSLLLLALSDESVNLQVVLSWTLGGIHTPDWSSLALLALLTALALWLTLRLAHGLDLLGLGEQVAQSMGLNPRRFSHQALLLAAAITALAVSWGGLVGFVGLVAPHAVRWLLGPSHKRLALASALASGALLAVLDGLARALLPPAEIPLGLLTALIGAPFFLLLLIRARPSP